MGGNAQHHFQTSILDNLQQGSFRSQSGSCLDDYHWFSRGFGAKGSSESVKKLILLEYFRKYTVVGLSS